MELVEQWPDLCPGGHRYERGQVVIGAEPCGWCGAGAACAPDVLVSDLRGGVEGTHLYPCRPYV